MPAPMPQRSSSLNKTRRELERRRKAISVAKGTVVKKSSVVPPPPPRLIPSVSGCAAGAATLKLANAPQEGVAKKIAYLYMGEDPKRCTAPPRRAALIPLALKAAKSTAPTALISHASTKVSTTTSHPTTGAGTEEYTKKPWSTEIQPRSSSISVKKGMTVKVRAPARTLSTGQRIAILHPAVVVSNLEDGYLQVVYKGKYPRRGIVRVPMDHVKTMLPTK